MKTFLRRLGCAAAARAIPMYGSEMLFWSVPPDGVSALDLCVTWLAYSLCAYVFLALLGITRRELQFAAAALAGLWLLRLPCEPRWEMLSLPLLTGLTLWALRREAADAPLLERCIAAPAPPARHALFLIVPAVASAVAWTAWTTGMAAPTHMAVCLATVTASVLI